MAASISFVVRPLQIVLVTLVTLAAMMAQAMAACPDAIAQFGGRVIPNGVQVASAGPFRVLPAAPRLNSVAANTAPVPSGTARVTFVGHASFLLESPQGVAVMTDYNSYIMPPRLPDIVTMNHTHDSHYTDTPDPGIKHVLRGWDPKGGMAVHNVRLRDTKVFNVQTNIGEYGDIRRNENSIFVIQISFMCFAHLSHLHHVLSKEQIAALGEIDVLFVPVDGSWTMSHEEAFHIIGQIKPKLIFPMHFSYHTPEFYAQAQEKWPVKEIDASSVLVSRETLPKSTELHILRGF